MLKSMKSSDYKNLLLQVMSIFIARATIGDLNPMAISFFAAMYMGDSNKLLTILCISFGMISVLQTVEIIKYLTIMITILILASLFKKTYRKINNIQVGIIAGFVTAAISLANNMFSSNIRSSLVLALAEGIAIFAFSIVLRKGIEAILVNKKGQVFNNEEMISVAIISALIIYGLPGLGVPSFFIQAFASLFTVLFVGYKYGAGYGGIMGVTCGLIMSIINSDFNHVGIFCLTGILAGTFRELGRITVSLVFSVGTIALYGLVEGAFPGLGFMQGEAIPAVINSQATLFQGFLTEGLIPLASGTVLFLILPDSVTYKVYNNKTRKDESFSNKSIQTLTKDKLREFSVSFHNLSGTFNGISKKKISLNKGDKKRIFNDLSEELCKDCQNCNLCWEKYLGETYQGIKEIIDVVESEGRINCNQIPKSFLERCIKLESFIAEARRIYDLEKFNMSCDNKLLECREAIAEQFSQIGFILDDFSDSIYKSSPSNMELERRIVNGLRTNHIFVDNLAIFEKQNNRKEIFIYAYTRGGHCITSKEVSQTISDIVGTTMIPSEKSKLVIAKVSDLFIFEEDANYSVLTGVSKMAKDGSLISGDNYSFICPDSGTAIMTLSDGMGTGEKANKESEAVINLLEQFIEAGFSKESAIKLINSVMLIKSGNQTYSTIDMSVINLYTGMCDFIKLGSSTTFIKNEDDVEIIQSSSLPIGMINQMDYEVNSKKLRDGNFIIMVTDGLIDCIPGEDKEGLMSEFIKDINMNNPKEIANAVLNFSLELNNWTPKDDMTVLVGGFWKKQ